MTATFSPTRRRFLTGTVAAAVLAACGGDSGTDEPSVTSTPGFPRTVTHGLGATRIPARPTRIVATADREQLDVLLAMHVRPVQVGISGDYDPVAPWLDAVAIESVDRAAMPDAFVPNLERIAAARPDLIVDAWSDEAGHEALSAIAPTIQLKTTEADSWETAQRMAGDALGEEVAASEAVAETRAALAVHADRLADAREHVVALAVPQLDQLVVLPGTLIGGRIMTELGMTTVTTPDGTGGPFSLEQTAELLGPADIIVTFEHGVAALEANPLFRSLPAVTAGRFVSVPDDVATACYQESTLSLRWAAAAVADAVLTAARGEGRRPA